MASIFYMIQSNAIQYQGNINSFINLYQDILAVVFAIPRAVFGVQIKETGNAVLTLSTKVSLYWQNLKTFNVMISTEACSYYDLMASSKIFKSFSKVLQFRLIYYSSHAFCISSTPFLCFVLTF